MKPIIRTAIRSLAGDRSRTDLDLLDESDSSLRAGNSTLSLPFSLKLMTAEESGSFDLRLLSYNYFEDKRMRHAVELTPL